MKGFDARATVDPADTIESSSCPACRSGSPPRDARPRAAVAVEG